MSLPQEIAGYRILARIGEGAASELYAVQHPRTKQVFALKHVIRKSDKDQRFLDQCVQEYAVGSKLHHSSIREMKRLVKHRRPFRVHALSLVMELVDAESLDRRLPDSQAKAVRIFRGIAAGLEHMHERGFVHADIKPTNVLFAEPDLVKIIDLGQACRIGTVKPRIQGTPGYMAPEQAHRQAITPKTDIYNFGAMMYWVLVGKVIPTALPPQDDSNSLYSGAVDVDMLEPPVPPHKKDPNVHPLLSRQIIECVQVHPDDRPESMLAVRSRLELILDLLENPPATPPSVVSDEDTAM